MVWSLRSQWLLNRLREALCTGTVLGHFITLILVFGWIYDIFPCVSTLNLFLISTNVAFLNVLSHIPIHDNLCFAVYECCHPCFSIRLSSWLRHTRTHRFLIFHVRDTYLNPFSTKAWSSSLSNPKTVHRGITYSPSAKWTICQY